MGGAYSDSAFTFEAPPPPAEGGVAIRGAALGWWNPNEEGPGNYNLSLHGKGEYMYLDEGQALRPGHVPQGQEEVLRHEELDRRRSPRSRRREPKWPTYPCEDCPSSGNTSITASSGQA